MKEPVSLNYDEIINLVRWVKEHDKSTKHPSNRYTTFTLIEEPGEVGRTLKVQCSNCKSLHNITDYGAW